MNRRTLRQISDRSMEVSGRLDKEGLDLLTRTHAWRNPLPAGGSDRGPVGGHSDPTLAAVLSPQQFATTYTELLRLLLEKARVDVLLLEFMDTYKPSDVVRGRVSSVAVCVVCDGPAVPARGGKCPRCYKRWLRTGRPDSFTMRHQWQKDQTAAQVRIHEHEQETA